MTTLPSQSAPRRSFIGRLAAGAVAIAGLPLAARHAEAAELVAGPDAWTAPLALAKHKQIFDAPELNKGFPMIFAGAYLGTMKATYGLTDKGAHAVIVLRHFGIPAALSDTIWTKYKLGEFFKIMDPKTNAPSTRNFFSHSGEGDMAFPQFSVDKLVDGGNTTFCVCNIALTVISGLAGKSVGVDAAAAYEEWKAGLLPGMNIVASGVLGVGRAQEKGCSYCFAG
jgi:hypothetical protein